MQRMIKPYLEAAVEIAQEAGRVLREELERPPAIAYKGEFDLVTQADRRSESVIVSGLQRRFPEHAVAAEEGTGKDTASEFRWHVDPLDGTTNFAHGYPCFCVSMALARKGELLLGVIYNPVYNELFTATRGEGAFFNGRRIQCSKSARSRTACFAPAFPIRTGTPIPISTTTGILPCARTACGATAQPLSTWPAWPAAVLTASGSSASNRGTRLPA